MPKKHQPSLRRSSTLPRRPGPSHEIEDDDDTNSYSRASYSQESSDPSKWSYPLLLSSPSPKHQTKKIDKKWGPNEELIMLADMLKFKAQGKDALTDIEEFTEIVRSELKFQWNSTEMKAEILRIKTKYKRRYREGKHKFQCGVKQEVFDTSKLIWGKKWDAEAVKGKGKAETSIAGGDRGKTKVEDEDVEFVGDEGRVGFKKRLKVLKKLEGQRRGLFKRIRRWIKSVE